MDYWKNHVLPKKKLSCGSLGCKHPFKAKGLTEPSPHWRVKNKLLKQKKSTRTTPKRKALNYWLAWGLERSFCSQLWIFYESWQNDDDNSLLSEDFLRRKEWKCMYIFNLHMKYKAFCNYLQTHTAVIPHFGAPHQAFWVAAALNTCPWVSCPATGSSAGASQSKGWCSFTRACTNCCTHLWAKANAAAPCSTTGANVTTSVAFQPLSNHSVNLWTQGRSLWSNPNFQEKNNSPGFSCIRCSFTV